MLRLSRLPLLTVTAAAALATLSLQGCKREQAKAATSQPSLGTRLTQGEVHDLRLTPDGAVALFLSDAQKPRLDGIPPQMLVGSLQAVPLQGGSTRKLAEGVVNVPGGYLVSPDSKWVLVLQRYNPASASGDLLAVSLQDTSSEPVSLGSNVSYMLVSPDSKTLAFVTNGVLKVGALPGGPFREVSGEVQDLAFSRDSLLLAYKRRLTAAGGLFLLALGKEKAEPVKLGEQAGDYGFSPDGKRIAFTQRSSAAPSTYDLHFASAPKWESRRIAQGASAFAFSEDGKWFARIEDQRPESAGNLVVGPQDGSKGRVVGEKAQDFSFSPDSGALASLELYDVPSRSGVMSVVTLPDGKPQRVGYRVPNYTWSPDGKSVAFLARFLKPVYTVDLMLYRLGEEKGTKVYPGVFGYAFSPEGKSLLFRSSCIREGRACDLYTLDLATKQPPPEPKKTVEGIFSFKHAPEGDRILVTYARIDSDLYDVAVVDTQTGAHKTVDHRARVPAYFADKKGQAVVYLVGERGRGGLYAATSLP